MRKAKGVKALYKRLDSIDRRERNMDYAQGINISRELARIIIHCHVYGLDLAEITKAGIVSRLNDYFEIV